MGSKKGSGRKRGQNYLINSSDPFLSLFILFILCSGPQLIRMALGQTAPIALFSETIEASTMLVWSLLGALLGVRIRSPLNLLFCTVLGLTLLFAVGFSLLLAQCWLPVVPPAIASIASAGLGASAPKVDVGG